MADREHHSKQSWIFQASPRYFDLREALNHIRIIRWRINQHKSEIQAGDDIFLWIAGAKGGMVARGTLISDPQVMWEAEEELPYVLEEGREQRLRAALDIHTILDGSVVRSTLQDHPVLGEIKLLDQPRGTNFPLTSAQAKALDTLCPSARSRDRMGLKGHEKLLRDLDDLIEQNAVADAERTEREQLVKSRVGQGRFRENVQKIESACRVSGVTDPRFLIASHIKPWRACNNAERLDGANGLMLSPNIDRLFDQGYISFDSDGTLLVRDDVERSTLDSLGVPQAGAKCGEFSPEQQRYLAYHRDVPFQNRLS